MTRDESPNLSSWSWKATPAVGVEGGTADGVTVLHAAGSGDDLLADFAAKASDRTITLVTADRELRRRVEALGAEVIGPGWLLELLG